MTPRHPRSARPMSLSLQAHLLFQTDPNLLTCDWIGGRAAAEGRFRLDADASLTRPDRARLCPCRPDERDREAFSPGRVDRAIAPAHPVFSRVRTVTRRNDGGTGGVTAVNPSRGRHAACASRIAHGGAVASRVKFGARTRPGRSAIWPPVTGECPPEGVARGCGWPGTAVF